MTRLGFELIEHRLEQFLPFELRAQVYLCGGTRQRQQVAQQRDIVVIPRPWREQCLQFAELGFDRIVAGETGGAFELGCDRISLPRNPQGRKIATNNFGIREMSD